MSSKYDLSDVGVQMPELQMPLHTLIELEPRPDGTMVERRYKIDIETTDDEKVWQSFSTTVPCPDTA